MQIPGTPIGPMKLPVSYTNAQLRAHEWDDKNRLFKRPVLRSNSKLKSGPVRRTRSASHYWRTKEYEQN